MIVILVVTVLVALGLWGLMRLAEHTPWSGLG
jgi:hypothetical protein